MKRATEQEDIRDQIADAIANCDPELFANVPAVMEIVVGRFPDAKAADFDAGLERALVLLRERIARDTAEADDLQSLAPLFEGMPEDMELGECARIKAEQGDPLALAFLAWEAKQAGGVQ